MLWSKVFQEAKCSREQNVLRSKMFLGAKYEFAKYEFAKCSKEQSVLGSKVCLSPQLSELLLVPGGAWCPFRSVLRTIALVPVPPWPLPA